MDYHSDRFKDFSVMIYKDEELYALLPANVVGDRVISHQGLTYGSFVLQDKAKLFHALDAFKAMLAFYEAEGIKELEIKVIPTFYNKMPADELDYFLYKANAQLLKKEVLMIVDYAHKLPFQKNRREGVNKALRAGLELKVDANFKDFWNNVLIPNLKNKHGINPVHSLEEIELLASRFPNNIKQVNIYKGDTVVAGTTVFLTETTVHPQYVSGNADKNAFGSLDLAYDYIINKMCDDKRYFDFNISSEDNGSKINDGLIFWKESCGARSYTANTFVVETNVHKTLEIPRV
ncbi:GNAT family N-acetyltransferase [Winogradskyella echinorum]|uniref:GNAT family N-acetyltransferase n=1 Tax=Winogradskyella echinorum TaxID=538189 RepID=A0ABR6XWR7_9FLAO|nr:GNAT family N-acetyltransferase [Winogradskyella echinorum]MBC3844829.1 GNAT family N-acetyltransferase [Winogradskyella echinorum]MBC5749177.1 GNAT family N-acetyltransferase [Winogradskyella echinorum]